MSDTYSLRVYCPNDADITAFVRGWLVEAFGGTTEYAAEGSWESPNGDIVAEDVTVVESIAETDSPAEEAKAVAQAAKRQDWHNEDCVMWEVRPVYDMGYE